jgi:valyl-tRNA synthetase
MDLLMETVTKIRTLRSEMNVPPGKVLEVVISDRGASGRSESGALLTAHAAYVRHLAKVHYTAAVANAPKPPRSVTAVVTDVEIFMPLEGSIDFEKVRARLTKDVAELNDNIARDNERLANPDFLQRAPDEKVQEVRSRIVDNTGKRDRLQGHLAALN